ncbi:ROK family transcriptional regulator [Catenuloplanes atrovinosus]|uniref:NBD/HSP70 family sugar kinase n=1 Tax=Catenuloplanes atrovinosus TaxID=137266 RepID=A0AAE4C989_9ACTN|nr:ROK family transcriptional regulator [Catenuloplanes atrovinosus]MDR7275803.1 putative NBD/HSP70 family sugar kinase [Catenuloplanes atrovinosus]
MDGPENPHQARLLRLLRDDGERSRAELGDAVGLSRSKAAVEVTRLADRGLIEGGEPAASRGGRRSSIVRLAAGMRFLSIALGATSLEVTLTDGALRPVARVTEQVDLRRGPSAVLGRAVELAVKVRAEAGGFLCGAGVGIPGPVSFAHGVPVSPPFLPGWDRHPVRDHLAAELDCPVLVDNDVNLMALGEKHAGIARPFDDFLFVKIGAGIGAGIVVGGTVYRGANGCAGDIGHTAVMSGGPPPLCVCGNTGCLEAHFGGAALARDATAAARSGRSDILAMRLASAGTLTARDVADALAAGDQFAMTLVRDGGRRVGQVLAGLVSFFNPGMIVIGGGLAGMGHALLAEIRGVVYRSSLPLATGDMPVVLSELGADAAYLGATRMISDHFLTAPDA